MTTNGQSAAVADATIAVNGLEALEVCLNFTPEITFDGQLARSDRLDDVVQLLRREILGANIRFDVRLLEDLLRGARADPVNVWQRSVDALVAGVFNS